MVQVKKAEMRQTIIDVATDEFMKKGYENASLRVIAQKSHTFFVHLSQIWAIL